MTRLMFRMVACLFVKPLGKQKTSSTKKMAQIKGKFNYKHKRGKMGTNYVEGRRE